MDKARGIEPIEVQIDDLAFGGEGVGRHEGRVYFVAGAFPGERVRALPGRRGKKNWQSASLVELLEESPDRVAARCSHTTVCGGCVYQRLAYPRQLAAKARQVRENLARIAGIAIEELEPPLPAPTLFHYRNKMEFSFAPRAWNPDGAPTEPTPGPALGLHVPGRFDAVFDLRDCALPDPEMNRLVSTVRDFSRLHGIPGYHGRTREGILRHLVVRHSILTGEWLVALVARAEAPALHDVARACRDEFPRIAGFFLWIHEGVATVARADREILVYGKDRIVERLLDLEFELSASSFFQTNTGGAEILVEELRRMAERAPRILDLYCGVGTLGLALADRCDRLVGIETVPSAVDDARRNARRNGIEHASFNTAAAEDWLGHAEPFAPDLVVVDPPRAGLHPRATAGLVRLAAPRILYVSCNPATLARDLASLAAGGYRADRLRILDLFPHTPHVESLVLLSRPRAEDTG